MAYRLKIEGTNIYLEFDPDRKELVIRDKANPGSTFFLNEVGLAILQYWLCMVDLNSAHIMRKTQALLHQMGLEIPDGICAKCQVPMDDCDCLSKRAGITAHPQANAVDEVISKPIRADCGHMVVVPFICARCAHMLCEACNKNHNCKTFRSADQDEDEDDDEEEDDDHWWNK